MNRKLQQKMKEEHERRERILQKLQKQEEEEDRLSKGTPAQGYRWAKSPYSLNSKGKPVRYLKKVPLRNTPKSEIERLNKKRSR